MVGQYQDAGLHRISGYLVRNMITDCDCSVFWLGSFYQLKVCLCVLGDVGGGRVTSCELRCNFTSGELRTYSEERRSKV